MDLGATICTPKRPACALCPWMSPCRARAAGTQETFPRKQPKAEGILRRGAAFVALRADDSILLRTRPPAGLLGGMVEPPTSAWEPDYDPARAILDAPLEARWTRAPGVVRHVFTHFPLELTVYFAKIAGGTSAPGDFRWTPRAALDGEALPKVMKKVLAHALEGRVTDPARLPRPERKRRAGDIV
jgi:A/G-specific adenine glycosylase